MNPIVKAKELVEMFWGLDMKFVQGGVFEADYEVAKRMALAAVDEIIASVNYHHISRYEDLTKEQKSIVTYYNGRKTFFNEVKLEIKKI